jgi:hypothetical protein
MMATGQQRKGTDMPNTETIERATRLHSINAETRLYSLKEGNGYSCLGFDVLESRIAGYAAHLQRHGIALPFDHPAPIGTAERFQQYEATAAAFARAPAMTETWFDPKTPEAVRRALENARLNGWRVRLFCGDTKTGRAWPEEFDVAGTISRSMGPMRVPLLIANARSHGGFAILDSCVVGIMTAPGRWLYRHPAFNVGDWQTVDSDMPEYGAAVTHDGKIHARFKTEESARRYVAFMRGERLAK